MTEFVRREQLLGGSLGGVQIRVVVEPMPLGTGGAVANAVQKLKIKGNFLVTNADTWLDDGIRTLANACAPAMGIVEVEDTRRYGKVSVHDGKVRSFGEKQESNGRGWINAGLYHLGSDLFAAWDGLPYSIERDVFPGLAKSGCLCAMPLNTGFIDIGVPEDYFRFCRWIESGKRGVL